MSEPVSRHRECDPVIEAYKAGVDRTLIRDTLARTPERVDDLVALAGRRTATGPRSDCGAGGDRRRTGSVSAEGPAWWTRPGVRDPVAYRDALVGVGAGVAAGR
jgi:hypothetical protein